MFTDQKRYQVRFEQGLNGMAALLPHADATDATDATDAADSADSIDAVDVVVVVDVLTFTTCVDVALGRGVSVLPYRWRDESAAAFAEEVDAVLARPRDEGGCSLSPPSLLGLPAGSRLVLPSPNGAMLSLAAGKTPCFAGCLRNAAAVARAAAAQGGNVAVIASGERWPDGGFRSALEDIVGAGAIIHHLSGTKSPEAELAEAVFLRFRDCLEDTLVACSGGRELAERGYAADMEMAAALNVSETAPMLRNGAYQDSQRPIAS